MTNFIKTLAIALLVVGCGNFVQDPLKDRPEFIRNGVPLDKVPQKPERPYLRSDSYSIDVESQVLLSEGQEQQIEIGARVYIPTKNFEIVVENMELFKGAKLEEISEVTPGQTEKKYRLTWTPPTGYTGQELSAKAFLRLSLYAETAETQYTSIEKDVLLLIERKSLVPRIVSYSFDKFSVLEGESATLSVTIEDNDSTDAEPPQFQFEPTAKGFDIARFMTPKSFTRETGTNRWVAEAVLDTSDFDLTDNALNAYLSFSVMSRYKAKSTNSTILIYIHNDLNEAICSLSSANTYTVTKGVKNVISFTLFDPTYDGEVSASLKTSTSDLPGAITLNCAKPMYAYKHKSNCEFSWDLNLADTTSLFPYEFEIEIKNSGKSGNVSVSKLSRVNMRVNVVAPTIPTTTTTTTLTTTSSSTTSTSSIFISPSDLKTKGAQ